HCQESCFPKRSAVLSHLPPCCFGQHFRFCFQFIESRNHLLWILRKYSRSEPIQLPVSSPVLKREVTERRFVSGNDFEIAASERARPRRARANTLKIIQHLARKRKQCTDGFATFHADGHHQIRGGFDDREHLPGGHGSRGVIRSFAFNGELQNI